MKSSSRFSWETLVIASSFIAVWVYFAARVWASRNQTELPASSQLLLLPALILLALIFVNRVRRVVGALRDNQAGATSTTNSASKNGSGKNGTNKNNNSKN